MAFSSIFLHSEGFQNTVLVSGEERAGFQSPSSWLTLHSLNCLPNSRKILLCSLFPEVKLAASVLTKYRSCLGGEGCRCSFSTLQPHCKHEASVLALLSEVRQPLKASQNISCKISLYLQLTNLSLRPRVLSVLNSETQP